MLDFRGDIIEPKYRENNLWEDHVTNDEMMVSKFELEEESDSYEELTQRVSSLCVNDGEVQRPPENPCFDNTGANEFDKISPSLDIDTMAERMVNEVTISKYQHSIKSKEVKIPSETIKAVHTDKPKGVTSEELQRVFRIDNATAKRTLKVTSQRLKRSKNASLHRRYGTNDRMLRYKHIKEFFYMDTMFATTKSGPTLRGNTCLQLFVTDKGYVFVCPMRTKGEVHHAMKEFFKKIGVPDAIICDPAREQILGDSRKLAREAGTVIRAIEPDTLWSNRAERYIGIFKQGV